MKTNRFIILGLLIVQSIFGQEKEKKNTFKFNKENFLKELSQNACKCIDSIDTFNKIKDSLASEINNCIDKQVSVYQFGIQMADIEIDLDKKKKKEEKKDINILINPDPNSKEYKEAYYELERDIVDNCTSIKSKISINDKVNHNSLSSNNLALEYYNKGLDATKTEDYKSAINYYKKAVAVDSDFAFAYDNMGICYRKLNNYDEAINAYEKSLKIDPYGLMPLQNIGVAYIYKKEYKKAIKAYEKLGDIQPDNPEVFYGIGVIYFQNLNNLEKGLDNMCKAYLLYIQKKSPYRSDAEKIIQMIYTEYKKKNNLSEFNKILEEHNISQN
ncbi:tetratricopeptide repeat protein [Flavobacterium jejuense]|uniref:Tetratricopeptide repeat protein n=1 Tax=Flavobacterium jejuense TaxID=1544455 RepID=A0ABX0IV94_9FLAO|nr:tetratricopeptide repeat protein [Flavobacterium jejuense]NHN27802.1 tetratricopeptide repeat protein [Flavobacterium jejuense]